MLCRQLSAALDHMVQNDFSPSIEKFSITVPINRAVSPAVELRATFITSSRADAREDISLFMSISAEISEL